MFDPNERRDFTFSIKGGEYAFRHILIACVLSVKQVVTETARSGCLWQEGYDVKLFQNGVAILDDHGQEQTQTFEIYGRTGGAPARS
jgi:hypothetical protein